MRFVFALLFLLLLMSAAGVRLDAQSRPVPQQPAPTTAGTQPVAALPPESDATDVREQLRQTLGRYPPDLGRILKMDPTMLQNTQYLAQYPGLVAFLSAHPEVVRNPAYYLDFVRINSDYGEPLDARGQSLAMWRGLVQGFTIIMVGGFIASILAWLVRTMLDHRRWLRVSRVQTEVHNKILDRFAGTGELLTYVQSSAGRRFLEAAPIPLDAAPRGIAAPYSRILWSVQAGIVLVVGGLGFQFVSGSVLPEVGDGLRVLGVLGIAFGLGFVVSGAASYFLARRMGLLETSASAPPSDGSEAITPS